MPRNKRLPPLPTLVDDAPSKIGVFYLELGGERKYSDEDVIDALKISNGLVTRAERATGIPSSIIWDRVEKSPRIRRVLDEIREARIDKAESKLDEALDRGEPYAVSLVLKTLGKERGYTERTELSGPDKAPLFDADHIVVIDRRASQSTEGTVEGEVIDNPKMINDGENTSNTDV